MALAALAAGFAGLLLYQSQMLEALPGCSGGSSCDTVLSSKWSSWLGVPVSLFAMGVYVAILCTAVMRDPESIRPQRSIDWVLLFGGITTIIAAVWFTVVQFGVIRMFCIYCMTTHVAAAAAGVMCLLMVQPLSWVKGFASAAGAALLAVVVLIVGQVMGNGPERADAIINYADSSVDLDSIEALDDLPDTLLGDPLSHAADEDVFKLDSSDEPDNTDTTGTNPRPANLKPRKLNFYGGKFAVDTTKVPIIGDPYAPKVIVILFDYNCPHCRETHEMLEKTKQKYGNELAIVYLPVPLDSKCNKLVRHTSPTNRYSCDLAKTSLAVWRIAPEKWAEFDKILITDEQKRTPARARIEARKLLDTQEDKEMDRGAEDDWIADRIELDTRIYALLGKVSKQTLLPMLITENALMSGSPRHPLDIEDLIEGKKIDSNRYSSQ